MNKLLINDHPLQVLPNLAAKIGLNEAILLQQIHYWLNSTSNERDGRKWIYNTFEEWQTQFPFWTVVTIKRIVKSLRDAGLIMTTSQYNKMALDRTLWYTIDYSVMDSLSVELPSYQNDTIEAKEALPLYQNDTTIVSNCYDALYQIDTSNNQRLPETTTENTKDLQAALAPPPLSIGPVEPVAEEPQPQPVKATPKAPPVAKPPQHRRAAIDSPADIAAKARWAELKAAYLDVLGTDKVNHGQVGSGIKQLEQAGYTPEQVSGCYTWVKSEPWWALKPVSPQIIFKYLPDYLRFLERQTNTNGTGQKERTNHHDHQTPKAKYATAPSAHRESFEEYASYT